MRRRHNGNVARDGCPRMDDAAGGSEVTDGDGELSRDDLRIELYGLLMRRAENERRWRLVRLAGGFAVIGLVLGYALVFDDLRFVSVTPILYGVVVMAGLRSSIEILYLTRHLVRIEDVLAEREPLFRWVSAYGVFGDGQALYLAEVDLNVIPDTALYTLVVAVYFVLVGLGLAAWTPLPGASGGLVPVTRGTLLLSYVLFSAVFLAIVVVAYLHYRRLARETPGAGAAP